MGEVSPGQIIILNGAPRSGKSSIAEAIQRSFAGVWMHMGVDRFMAMAPPRHHPGIGLRPGGERPDLEPLVVQLYAAMYDSIAAHSRRGLSVAVDVGHHDCYAEPRGILPRSMRQLAGLPTLVVGVRCPLAVILERRRATGYPSPAGDGEPTPRPILLWQEQVHLPGIYDMEVDTSQHSPDEAAALIAGRLADGPPPSARARLAALEDRR